VLALGAIGYAAELVAPTLVLAAEIALHRELAVAHHHDGVDVGVGPLGDEGIELAQPGGIEPDLGLRGEGPTVVERDWSAADFRLFGEHQNRRSDERQQSHEQSYHPDLAYVVRGGGQGHVSVGA
jgi:hypothetical protein